jgi:hypothetical protein
MTWLVSAAALLAALLLLLAWILGRRVPRSHVATAQVRYAQTPARVWESITNVMMAPNWRSGVRQVERLPDRDGHQVWVEVRRRGRVPLEFELVEPERKLVTRTTGERLAFGGSWTFVLTPDGDDGCTLTLTEDGEIYSPTFRFFAYYVFGYEATLRRYLKDLGKKFGEKAIFSQRMPDSTCSPSPEPRRAAGPERHSAEDDRPS